MVLTSDSSDYTKANLLYRVCENTGLVTMYNEKVVLPASEFKAHTSLLILGLCFLVEVGTLYVDIGMYKKLVMSIDIMIPYIVLGSALVSRAPFAPPSESRARARALCPKLRQR